MKIEEKKCVICNNKFNVNIDTKKGKSKKTCSTKCARELGKISSLEKRECHICKNIYQINKGNPTKRCEKCRKLGRYEKKCIICNNNFFTNHKETLTCSKKCSYNFSKVKEIEYKCDCCGKIFKRDRMHIFSNKKNYCSNRCNNRAFSKNNPTRYGGTFKRRRKEILNRDGNSCLLCHCNNDLEIHHFIKILEFENPNDAHYDENVGTFCHTCHRIVAVSYTHLTLPTT